MPSVVPDWGYPVLWLGMAVISIGVLVTALFKK